MGRLKLFDDNEDSSNDDLSKIEIDHNYAKRLEHNKKREDLQRYEELKKQGRIDDSDSEESSSEEEEMELFKPSKKTDSKFFDALIKVKNKDPILRDKDAKLFDSDSESESGSDDEIEVKGTTNKKKKPMYLKDVISKQLIEAGPEFDDEEMENEGYYENKKVKSYSEEQEEIRRNLLKTLKDEEIDEEGDLFRVKDNGVADEEEEEGEIGKKLDVVFGEDGKLDEETKFLKDYFRHKMWINDEKDKGIAEENLEFSEDEEEIEKQEDYEREFNFRFEENAGDRVMGHSRIVEGSVRKKDNARKSQRERKEERMARAEFERKEELKRLKNLKKKEINQKLEKIKKVAGLSNGRDFTLDEDDLEEEFNPEEHDRKMKEAFGDEYYEAEDVDPAFGSDEDNNGAVPEKPDFEMEDDLEKLEDGEQLMEEYYKLDYEGTIGDLKTRFKYKPVAAKRFGLSPAEIMMIDDKDLNQYVPLKKLAPYEENGWKVPRVKTLQLKEKMKELRNGEVSGSIKKRKKNRDGDSKTVDEAVNLAEYEGSRLTEVKSDEKMEELCNAEASGSIKKCKKNRGGNSKAVNEVANLVENEGSQSKEVNDDESDLSRRVKRRRRQNELKLSQSRLMAYGKIPSKSKSGNQ